MRMAGANLAKPEVLAAIDKLRGERNWTREELSRRMVPKTSSSVLTNIWLGKKPMGFTIFTRIMDALGVHPSERMKILGQEVNLTDEESENIQVGHRIITLPREEQARLMALIDAFVDTYEQQSKAIQKTLGKNAQGRRKPRSRGAP